MPNHSPLRRLHDRIRARRARRDLARRAAFAFQVFGCACLALPMAGLFVLLALGAHAEAIAERCPAHVTHGGAVHCQPAEGR